MYYHHIANHIGDKIIKLTMYVDDITLFVSDTASGDRIYNILHEFSLASGLKANVDKTEGMWIGEAKTCAYTPFGIKWPKTPIKILGIYFSHNSKAADNFNFITKLDKLTKQLRWWKSRDLTILGRVTIVKNIGLSKLNYVSNVLHVPHDIMKQVNSLIYQFVWGTKSEKVKRDIVNQDYEFGGLKMCSFDICNKATKIKWIAKYLDPSTSAVWKSTFEYLCAKQNLSLYLQSNFSTSELCLPSYYKDSIEFWKNIKSEQVTVKEDLCNQLVWYNTRFTIHDKTVYNHRLLNCGLWNVLDLYNVHGNLLSFEIWKNRGAQNSDYLTWRAIVNSVPIEWKQMINDDVQSFEHCIDTCKIVIGENVKNIMQVTEKDLKKLFINERYKKLDASDFKSQNKYNSLFNTDTMSWSKIYQLPFQVLCENKIIDLQYRIVHRYVGTNRLLFKIGKSVSPNCESCMMYPESIEHLFFGCFVVKNFWFKLIELYSLYVNSDISVTCQDVLLMYEKENDFDNNNINILILYGKRFIYDCKLKRCEVSLNNFTKYFYSKLCLLQNVNCKNKVSFVFLKGFIEHMMVL